ncbi:hypothetical protein JYU34_016639 [Plutella xylostella]|uniref:Uncharacterized protein n=2 Tax=Plutella xylostella TaxID=51655 RepID=A0ABQ7Q351_PLUXY|nr:protein anon-73B1 [Plutella xylostella]KAG7299650.1 hypothetical protein JYU34_016639 [Plutella xylostella]CAG9115700.1 unnamed protein product [Plutella xylostella]
MIPSEVFMDDYMSAIIRYGLYIGAVFQVACLFACVTLTDEQSDHHQHDKAFTDSSECSSEQSSPGHRPAISRPRRHDKKKRR